MVNRVIAAYDKATGDRVWISHLGSFLPGSSGDPRVVFDQHSDRWIVIVSDFSSRIYLAVSRSDDPTGNWFKTNFVVSQGADAGRWPDYPTLGVDTNGIYSAAYMVGGNSMSIFAIDKAPLIAASPSLGTVTAFRNLAWEGAIQPVHAYGNPGGEYLISRRSTSMRVRLLTGPMTSPTLTDVGFPSIPSHSAPPDAPALGSTTPLDTVGPRLMNAVYRDGSIWTAHTIGVNGRAACRWYEIAVAGSPSVNQYGTVSDSSLYYFFPGIVMSARGDVVMGFTGSNANQYAGAYYTGRKYDDPPGAMADPAVLKDGQAAQNNIDGYGRNRWGDYSLSTLDPDRELDMWTIQEYGHATNVWGTWIGRLSLFADCNTNGVNDPDDIAAGTSDDCNENSIPDECEPQEDCQSNGVQDICDIAAGTSLDCNVNSVPDECETDCNGNEIPDDCDIAAGTSEDCQANGIPDECETDCNGNAVPDDCDITAGTSEDCQINGIPDECDIAGGASFDCTGNNIPDECEADCNTNGVRDDCDIDAGTSDDCNTNGRPDECDVPTCFNVWDGFPKNDPPEAFYGNQPLSEVDYNGDGVYWDNPVGNALIGLYGCETDPPDPFDFSVHVSVPTSGDPEAGYVASEYFRELRGGLGCGTALYTLSFKPRVLGVYGDPEFNHKYDWKYVIYDANTEKAVIQVHFASTQSSLVPENQRGRILVKNPAGNPAYLSTGIGLGFAFDPVSFETGTPCYDFEVVLDNMHDSVKLYVDGELKVETTRLQADACRMDYFRLQPVSNSATTGGDTVFKLDNSDLCVTGDQAASPADYDCNSNGTLDECDITSGASEDCNRDGVPDECQVFGDFDGDGDIDSADYATFCGCLTGPASGPIIRGCELGNFDCDEDLSLDDFAAFQRVFTGAG